ncbi:hypothetical protein FRC12_010186 [Ceratobasidium sp. 428]|nr:hypothetical protein FRC12_010186 [Ceratobasidium sp. 428]
MIAIYKHSELFWLTPRTIHLVVSPILHCAEQPLRHLELSSTQNSVHKFTSSQVVTRHRHFYSDILAHLDRFVYGNIHAAKDSRSHPQATSSPYAQTNGEPHLLGDGVAAEGNFVTASRGCQDHFPQIFNNLAPVVTNWAPPLDEDEVPDPPSDTELGPNKEVKPEKSSEDDPGLSEQSGEDEGLITTGSRAKRGGNHGGGQGGG